MLKDQITTRSFMEWEIDFVSETDVWRIHISSGEGEAEEITEGDMNRIEPNANNNGSKK